ncbi:MAG: 2OG-Fe(II) oxygenase [Minicystis sp.]
MSSSGAEVTPFFDRGALLARAEPLRARFLAADPFPHIVLDDFLPAPVAERVAREFPPPDLPGFKRVDHAEQAGRLGHLQRRGFAGAAPFIRYILGEFNGQAMIDFLERLTGIVGLIPDPHFRGAGVHHTLPGGHLALHADHNRDRFRQLERRLTVLVYFNQDWQDDWGGHLQLWPPDLSRCAARIAPLFNRCVVMVHRSDAWHGYPEPLRCPPDRTRRALVAYYYTVDRPAEERRPPHPAIWVEPR